MKKKSIVGILFLIVFGMTLTFVVSNPTFVVANPDEYDGPWDTDGWTITSDTELDDDLFFDGDGIIIGADNIRLNLNGFTIEGTGESGIGITVIGKSGVTIEGGEIRNFEKGILLQNSDSNAMHDLTVRDNNYGIYLEFSNYNEIYLNVICHNTNSTPQPLMGGITMWGSQRNFISGNRISSNRDGIYLLGSHRNVIGGNRIEDNERHGIKLLGTSGGPSEYNRITSNKISGNNNGIYIQWFCIHNRIEGNTIRHNSFGIYLDLDEQIVEAEHDNTPHYNNIFENENFGIWANKPTDAQFNWWDEEEGPTVEGEDEDKNKVTSNIAFDPCLPWSVGED